MSVRSMHTELPASSLRGGWRFFGKNNDEMVTKFAQIGFICTKSVEDAFRAVPRGAFVPLELQDEAYDDSPIRGDPHVHLSAPHMYATVLEALQLTPGLSFLNIGSGTGYFSCLTGYILKPGSINHGIEIHEDLVEFALERIKEFLYFCPHVAQDICRPNILAGNCFRLDPMLCKYDRVYCGAACPPDKVSLILALTKVGGFAIVPCRNKLLKIQRISATDVEQTCISEVCFAPLVSLSSMEQSLPKLYFPPEEKWKQEKPVQFIPPDGVVTSRNPARTTLARIRALQDATNCLECSKPLALPFCYVPSQRQLQELTRRKAKHSSAKQASSPVDKTIPFFGSQAVEQSQSSEGEGCIWEHLHGDKLWETVLEHYYGLCNGTVRSKLLCSQLYMRQKIKKVKTKRNSKSCPSYAELARKLGITSGVWGPRESTESDRSKKCSTSSVDRGAGGDVDSDDTRNATGSTRCNVKTASPGNAEGITHQDQDEARESLRPSTSSAASESSGGARGANVMQDFRNSKRYKLVLIELEEAHMEKLRQPFAAPWGPEDDQLLVRFLCDSVNKSSGGQAKGWFKADQVRPGLFARSDILAFPRLASCTPEQLAYRALLLCRVARVLDSILHLLAGPSLLRHQSEARLQPAQLDSFSEASFVSSHSLWDKPSAATLEAEEDLRQFTEQRLEDVRSKKKLNLKKVRLRQTLQDKYRDQEMLLQKQLCLVEEQHLLVQNLREAASGADSPCVIQSSLQDMTSMKVHRQELLSKQQKLLKLQAEQEKFKSNLTSEMKKLQEEEQQLSQAAKAQRKRSDTAEASHFPGAQRLIRGQGVKPNRSKNPPENGSPADLLPRLRFLLPLCPQRCRLTQKMLRMSELAEPDQMPVITVNRRTPLGERCADPRTKSVVLQIHRELKWDNLHYRWNKWKYDQWWEVKFIEEGIIDQGGGFRDSLAELADELCPQSVDDPEVLPYFIKTPNHRDHIGDHQECYIPSPSCVDFALYRWIGQLMGAAFRSDESLTLAFPPFVWKLLVGEHVTWAQDYAAIDVAAVKLIDDLEILDEETYQGTYSDHCTFTTVLSDGREVELIPGGLERTVTADERPRYAKLVRQRRTMEFTKQLVALKEGLTSVIPESVLGLTTWGELEKAVCGDPDISVAVLKLNCKYGDELTESSGSVRQLWATLAEFTCEEKSRFLRFVTGRKRPPAPFVVVKASADPDTLPNASTCASTLFMPAYSSQAVATEKLRYAIFNCVAIDTDTSPW